MAAKEVIKVLIADDHAIVREGLKQILADSSDIVVAGNAENGFDAIKLARRGGYAVILLDISLPDRNGIEVLKQLRKECPKIAVLMLSMYVEPQYAVMAMKAYANAYLTKDTVPDELVAAIRCVAAGGHYVSQRTAADVLMRMGKQDEPSLHESLSQRERHIMMKIVRGQSLTEIGVQMSLSVKTVSTYRTRLLQKGE